jgi:hypothetical protein
MNKDNKRMMMYIAIALMAWHFLTKEKTEKKEEYCGGSCGGGRM